MLMTWDRYLDAAAFVKAKINNAGILGLGTHYLTFFTCGN